jgi:hypothetical protein
MTAGSGTKHKPAQLGAMRDHESHRLTTELVRASLLLGVRYGKHGPSPKGLR